MCSKNIEHDQNNLPVFSNFINGNIAVFNPEAITC